jgi:hypothetical protein
MWGKYSEDTVGESVTISPTKVLQIRKSNNKSGVESACNIFVDAVVVHSPTVSIATQTPDTSQIGHDVKKCKKGREDSF